MSGSPSPGRISYFILLGVCLIAGCLPASRRAERPTDGSRPIAVSEGEASYYADKFEGRPTASGEIFRQEELTGAHREYPFGTLVRVVNLTNGLDVTVRINDRGPSKQSRVIDLSRGAAERIGMVNAGVARVRLEVMHWGGAGG